LLMHVVDCAALERDSNIEQVNLVLDEIDADEVLQLRVYNKIDLLDDGRSARIDRDESGKPVAVWVSAIKRQGFELLKQAIGELVAEDVFVADITLPPADAKLRSVLFDLGAIQQERYEDNGDIVLSVRLQRQDFRRALAQAGIDVQRYLPEPLEFWQEH